MLPDDVSKGPDDASGFPPGSSTATAPLQYNTFTLSFTGATGEFFRIWIVNVFLTIVTVGFYTPWARVRSRRYFHANTRVDGHAFDYLAKPINILWGYLIVLAFVVAYNAAGFFNPFFALPLLALYVIAGPWLVYKAMRFKARNTSYRNVRFHFNGSLKDAYVIFLGMMLLVPLTLGFIVPYWIMKQKEYFYKNLSFGDKPFSFTPQPGEYYTRYIIGGVIGTVTAAIFGAVMAGFGLDEPYGEPSAAFYTIFFLSYIPLLIVFSFIQIYIFVSLFNYNLGQLLLGKTSFDSKLKVGKFYWITITNIFASVLTLGLLFPWAAIRKARYMAESIAVSHPGPALDGFVSSAGEGESALGDAAADAFDFDIGW